MANTGPSDTSVLVLQNEHCSSEILRGVHLEDKLSFKNSIKHILNLKISTKVGRIIDRWGFYGVLKTARIGLDQHLLTALIERWRPETHTFFFVAGEATITLQDVSVIWGLRINGVPIIRRRTRRTPLGWSEFIRDRFGWIPNVDVDFKGKSFRIAQFGKYLLEKSNVITDDDPDEDLNRYARGICAMLLCCVLFPDNKGDTPKLMLLDLLASDEEVMELSWGSAVLAYLYRNLCQWCMIGRNNLGGPMRLLMMWAYSRICRIKPHVSEHLFPDDEYDPQCRMVFGWRYVRRMVKTAAPTNNLTVCRDALDLMSRTEFIWLPYNAVAVAPVEDTCRELWKYRGPIMFFGVVEPHNVHRVTRQFALPLCIPPNEECSFHETHIPWRESGEDWAQVHSVSVATWVNRFNLIYQHTLPEVTEYEYHTWYSRVAVLYLGTARPSNAEGWIGGVVQPIVYGASRLSQAASGVADETMATQYTQDSNSMYEYLHYNRFNPYPGNLERPMPVPEYRPSSSEDFHTAAHYSSAYQGGDPLHSQPGSSFAQSQGFTPQPPFHQPGRGSTSYSHPTPFVYGQMSHMFGSSFAGVSPVGRLFDSAEPIGTDEGITHLGDEDSARRPRRGRRMFRPRRCGTGGHFDVPRG